MIEKNIFSFYFLYNAYLACRSRKRGTINALRFEADLLGNLKDLENSLASGLYRPSRSVCFITEKPKLREIFAADFKDRVVHHLLVPLLEDIYEPKFIYDSYACRREKGTHAAVKRLQYFMNKVTKGGRCQAWYIQLDIRSFFMSIDKQILLGLLKKQLANATVAALVRTIVDHNCSGDYIYKGDPTLLAKVPPHKSLLKIPTGKGLPIGNLTSQFFANVYLNELDQFVKHTLKAVYYLRYVDDFILLDPSRAKLLEFKATIDLFLARKLALSVKQDFVLKTTNSGADFLGYIVRGDYLLARRRVVGNLRSRLDYFEGVIVARGAVGSKQYTVTHLRFKTITQLRQVLSSYLGHLKHAATFKLVKSLFAKYLCLKNVFVCNDYRLLPSYEPAFLPSSFKEQYRWFQKSYQGFLIFCQVGRFCEIYTPADGVAAGLKLGATKNTRGLGTQYGFPLKLFKVYKNKARRAFYPYIVVGENGYYPSGLKKRRVTEIFQTTVKL